MTEAPRGERSGGAARAVAGEVVRGDLLAALGDRWTWPITTLVAGPGFGKSTVLAQADRLHLAAPRGHQVIVRCDAGSEQANHLAEAIVVGLQGDPSAGGEPSTRVVEAMRSWSPLPVCLILDDVHELPDGSSGAELLAALVIDLPADAHLVLAGRRLPQLPLARLEAADQVLRFDAADLAFGPSELDEIATGADRPVASLAELGGWPALVRLALTAPVGAPRRYLWDEVISGLEPTKRAALIVLSLLHRARPDTLAELVGEPIDIEELVAAVPLLDHEPGGTVRCHQLWEEATGRLADEATVRRYRTDAVSHLLDRGEINRAGLIAARSGDPDLLTRPVFDLVITTIGAFPADTADRWLHALGHRPPGHLAVDLLEAGRRQARDASDPTLRPLLDRLVNEPSLEPKDLAIVLPLATMVAYSCRDIPWLMELIELGRGIDPAASNPSLQVTIAVVDAATAELFGDPDAGLRTLDALGPPDQLGEIACRFYLHLLLLAGRAADAIPLAETRLSLSSNTDVRAYADLTRWANGEPEPMMTSEGSTQPIQGTNDWAGFAHFILVAPICAAVGADRQLRQVMAQLNLFDPGDQAKDRAQLLVAKVVNDIMTGNESMAAQRYADHLDHFPLTDRSSNLHLRRFPALGVVLVPEVRAAWSTEAMGPSLRRNVDAGLALVAAREGNLDIAAPLPPTRQLVTSLPLTWSVELLALAHLAGHPEARDRFAALVDIVGLANPDEVEHHRVHRQLESLVAAGVLQPEAAGLAETTPRPPTTVTRIELLGPMRILVDGEALDRPDLRRTRVREVIGLLVVEGSISRDRLMELVWADLDRTAAARNLRVTLTYVRKVLDGSGSDGGSHLRADGKQVALVRSSHLQSDLWDVLGLRDSLEQAAEAGDPMATEAALVGLAAIDGRDPMPDLARLASVEPLTERVRSWITDAGVTLGERRLAQGRPAEALELAGSVRAAAPFSLAAGRLALAAQLQGGDESGVAREIDELRATMTDLGVPADQPTEILLARAERQLMPISPAADPRSR